MTASSVSSIRRWAECSNSHCGKLRRDTAQADSTRRRQRMAESHSALRNSVARRPAIAGLSSQRLSSRMRSSSRSRRSARQRRSSSRSNIGVFGHLAIFAAIYASLCEQGVAKIKYTVRTQYAYGSYRTQPAPIASQRRCTFILLKQAALNCALARTKAALRPIDLESRLLRLPGGVGLLVSVKLRRSADRCPMIRLSWQETYCVCTVQFIASGHHGAGLSHSESLRDARLSIVVRRIRWPSLGLIR